MEEIYYMKFTKKEKIKVVERAITLIKSDEHEFMCNALTYAIRDVKRLGYCLDIHMGNELLEMHFDGLLEIANKHVKDYVKEHGKYGIYYIEDFTFNGKSWFTVHTLEHKDLRLKLLELYLKQLKTN